MLCEMDQQRIAAAVIQRMEQEYRASILHGAVIMLAVHETLLQLADEGEIELEQDRDDNE